MSDRWAEWLRVRRDGGSPEQRRVALEFLAPKRDRLLDLAGVKPGEVLLDVGCGDGLIGLGALDRGAQVIFSDISEECLADCRAIAGDGAEYRLASATDLGDVEADVVTTRSVLIYVADKPRAFSEFFRVLRPSGRISLFEPINRFGMEERRETLGFCDVLGVEALLARVTREVDRVETSSGDLDPMIDFDERDLLAHGEEAGFVDLRLELIVEVCSARCGRHGIGTCSSTRRRTHWRRPSGKRRMQRSAPPKLRGSKPFFDRRSKPARGRAVWLMRSWSVANRGRDSPRCA